MAKGRGERRSGKVRKADAPRRTRRGDSAAIAALDCGSASCRFSEAGIGKGGSVAPALQSPAPSPPRLLTDSGSGL